MSTQKLEWRKAICPICGKEYQFILAYRPETCDNFDCLYKYHHKEALERRARMKGAAK